jgi:hypothetical protein
MIVPPRPLATNSHVTWGAICCKLIPSEAPHNDRAKPGETEHFTNRSTALSQAAPNHASIHHCQRVLQTYSLPLQEDESGTQLPPSITGIQRDRDAQPAPLTSLAEHCTEVPGRQIRSEG